MIRIRPARAADGPAIARIRAESWQVAYAGVIPAPALAEMTAPEAVAREGEWRSTHSMAGVLIAESHDGGPADGAPADGAPADGAPADGGPADSAPADSAPANSAPANGESPELIGFAAFGRERREDDDRGQPGDEPPDHGPAELYAIYVVPSRWSTGAGSALLDGVLALAAQSGYTDISLWVLEANARARRFYERVGFALTGESAVLSRLDGVLQVRYRRLLG
jgi:ribosomal protein S18 acetylase RimI-like enzyme